jgi:GT2 family glycosyltransferase
VITSHVFFATPTYRSEPGTALSWAFDTKSALGLSQCKVKILNGCAWLHLAYALLVADFLASDCRVMMIRDDDVFPDAETVARMLEVIDDGAPAVVAPYKVRDEDRFDVVLEEDGRFRWAGVGCSMLRREVLEALWDIHAPELGFTHEGRAVVAIFRDLLVERDDGVQLVHEDHAFWYRVRSAGYAVAVLDDVLVPHAGRALRYQKPRRA